MSCITESQFHTIQKSFQNILEIGQRNADNSLFLVMEILSKLDSTHVPPSLKERVVEIVETESSATMQKSLNEALAKHFLPQIPTAPPLATLVPPVKLESKSHADAIPLPAQVLDLAKQAGITEAALRERLIFVKIEGRPCIILGEPCQDLSWEKFRNLLSHSAENQEISSFRDIGHENTTRKGTFFTIENFELYLVARCIQFCIEKEDKEVEENQEWLLLYMEIPSFYELMKTLPNQIIEHADIIFFENFLFEGALLTKKLKSFLAKFDTLYKMKHLTASDKRRAIDEFKDKKFFWRSLCSLLLKTMAIKTSKDLPKEAVDTIATVIEQREDQGVRQRARDVVLEIRHSGMAETVHATLPRAPKDLLVVITILEKHVPGFLKKLSAKCRVETVS
jgi:hypothetical protein